MNLEGSISVLGWFETCKGLVIVWISIWTKIWCFLIISWARCICDLPESSTSKSCCLSEGSSSITFVLWHYIFSKPIQAIFSMIIKWPRSWLNGWESLTIGVNFCELSIIEFRNNKSSRFWNKIDLIVNIWPWSLHKR